MANNLLLGAAAGLMALAVQAGAGRAVAQTRTTLDIYVVDVEGGNATLYVAPSGESVLIDTGNVAPDAAKRDAGRIMAAARDARLTQIDHLITTHWHGDHFGGMVELAKQIPIRDFIDHGPNIQPVAAFDEFFAKTYPALYGAPSIRSRNPAMSSRSRGSTGASSRRPDRCSRRRLPEPVRRIRPAQALSRSRSTPPRTRSRSAASSRSASSGWRNSATSPETRLNHAACLMSTW